MKNDTAGRLFCSDYFLYRLCGHVFMQYASVPLMRPLFCAVLSCGRAFALSCFSMRTKPLHSHAFTQLNPLRRHILRSCVLHGDILYGHILMRLRFLCSHAFYAVLDEMVLRGTDLRLGAWGWPLPLCGAMGQSSQPARSSPGRPKEMEARPYFPRMASMVRSSFSCFSCCWVTTGASTDPAAGRSRRCR